MIDAHDWLSERLAGAPAELRARMTHALSRTSASVPIHDRLAQAAEACLARGLKDSAREGALALLAADALFTHACEAAAEKGSSALNSFAAAWDAARFEQLLPKAT